MADRVVLLSGEHSSLPRAELRALLAVHDAAATTTDLTHTVVRVTPGDEAGTDAALRRMALCHSVAVHWGHGDILDAVTAAKCMADGQGSVAVRAERTGKRGTLRTTEVEKEIGQALAEAGHAIDLSAPDRTVTAWIHDDHIVVGERLWDTDRGRYERRVVTDRAHFSPITMHPRRAACLVHLARVAEGGTILDPFCGTGGTAIEAASEGYEVVASDIDDWMVQGTLQALADAGDEPLPGTVFRSDVGDVPDGIDPVDGIVTDLPYGRASTTDYEAVEVLYGRAFTAFAELLAPGRLAVIGCADPGLGRTIAEHGFTIEEEHAEYVHKSLTRHYIVAKRA